MRAELEELQAAKAAFVNVPEDDFAAEMTVLSLEAREAELLAEESLALLLETEGDVEVVLDGGAVEGHAVEASFLSDVVGRLQGLVNAVAEARAGQARPRGQVREDIRGSVRMMVEAFAPGSFGIRLAIPPQPGQLFGKDALGSTISLFDPDPEQGEFLTLMRLDRVRANYGKLMESLARHSSSMAIASRDLAHARAFTSRLAQERLDWMELIEVGKQPLSLTGTLVGGDVDLRTYHLEAEDTSYKGKVLETAVDDLKRVRLGADVHVRLLVVTRAHADGIVPSRTQYYLEAVEELGDEGQTRLLE